MSHEYSLQTGEIEYFERVISSRSSSPVFFRETFEKKFPSEYYGKNKILGKFSPEVLQSISPLPERVSLCKGQSICEDGDAAAFVYFPETAVIAEFQLLPDGKTAGVSLIGSEGLHGVAALLGSRVSKNWAQVLVAGTAFKIGADALRQYFEQCGFVRKNILRYLDSYLAQISQRVICNAHHSVGERLCSWILMLDDRCENYLLSLTQEQIAFFLGAQRPSVTIITQNLREKGIISYKRGKFSILNRYLLESAACACYKAAKLRSSESDRRRRNAVR